MTTWSDVIAARYGLRAVRHAVLTFSGTWAPPGVGYCSNVVDGLNLFVGDQLCYEVPVDYPAAFGPIGRALGAPSYQQSVGIAVQRAGNWIVDNPRETFALGGYSQGAEAASRIAMELAPGGSLAAYADNFIGGYSFGNPCRGAGFVAPGIADPGGHGISSTRMTELPTIGGQVVWADYVHSKANGDQGDDMYALVPTGPAGIDMTEVYTIATAVQFNDFGTFASTMVNELVAATQDVIASPIAALEAAARGLAFVAAPGGPTAPHISYLGEIGGYSNLVAQAVGFLAYIATLTPARAAA